MTFTTDLLVVLSDVMGYVDLGGPVKVPILLLAIFQSLSKLRANFNRK